MPQPRTVLLPFATALLLGLGLAGCGGGGGGSTTQTAGVSLSGSVVKGQIRYGVVKVYEVVNGVVGAVPLIIGETDGAGQYQLSVPSGHTGPFKVVVGIGPNSQMVCDAPLGCSGVAYGALIPANQLPSDLSMKALIPSKSAGASVPVNVSPLSDMAASYAESRGLSSDSIQAANTKVGTLFGITDLTGTTPVDVTDSSKTGAASADSLRAGIMAAAVAQLAGGNPANMNATIRALSSTYASNLGQLPTRDAADDDDVVALRELVDGADDVAAGISGLDSAVSSTLSGLSSYADSLADLTDTDEDYTYNSDGLATAKALVGEVRTFWGALSDPNEAMQPLAEAFNTRIALAQQAGALINGNLDSYQTILAEAVDYAINRATPTAVAACPGVSLSGIPAVTAIDPDISGCVTLTSSYLGPKVDLLAGNPVGITLTATLGNGTQFDFVGSLDFNDTKTVLTFAVGSGAIVQPEVFTLTLHSGTFKATFPASVTLANFESIEPKALVANLGATLAEDAAHSEMPVSFVGTVGMDTLLRPVTEWYDVEWVYDPLTQEESVVNTPNEDTMPLPRTLSLQGEVSDGSNRYDVGLTAHITNTATFQLTDILPVQYSHPNGGSYKGSSDGNTLTFTWGWQRVSYIFDPASGMVRMANESYDYATSRWVFNGGSAYEGTFDSLLDFFNGYYGWVLHHINFWVENEGFYMTTPTGAINYDSASGMVSLPTSLASVSGVLNGILYEPDWWMGYDHDYYFNTPSNYMLSDLTVTISVDLDTLPALTLSLSGRVTGYEKSSASATITYNAHNLNLSMSSTSNGASLTATNSSGASLTFNLADEEGGSLVYDGQVYGVLDDTAAGVIIRYLDGSFESL